MTKRIVIPMLNYYPDHPSGSVRLAFDQAVYMANQGHEVWVITQDPTHQQPEYAFRDNLHVLHYPAPRFSLFDPRRANAHQRAVQGLLARHIPAEVDLLHGHTLLSYDGAQQFYGADVHSCYSVHSPVKPEILAANRTATKTQQMKNHIAAQMLHRVEKRCLLNSTVITSDSAFTRDFLMTLHSPAIGHRVQVIPGWVDSERFQIRQDRDRLKQRFGWPLSKPALFTLRRLVPRNGIDRLIQALKIVHDAGLDFHMIIGGGGPLQSSLEHLTAELGLAANVHFVGRVSEADLPLLYAAADLFILPTTALECFGLITLEAFAAGRPVLATPVGAIPEVIQQIEPRWLCRDASPAAIAEAIIAYLNGDLPTHAPQTLRDFAQTHYSAQHVIPSLVATALEHMQ